MKLLTWARRAYVLAVVLGILLFLPQTWFPLMTGKIAAVAVCLLLAGRQPLVGAATTTPATSKGASKK